LFAPSGHILLRLATTATTCLSANWMMTLLTLEINEGEIVQLVGICSEVVLNWSPRHGHNLFPLRQDETEGLPESPSADLDRR